MTITQRNAAHAASATEPAPAIEAAGLRKSYGTHEVLRGIDLSVPRGTVYALLGPNGAGKTTAVRILATLATADGGTARVAGHDVRTERSRVRRSISLTGQFAAVDEMQTGTENLRMMARLAPSATGARLSRAEARTKASGLLARFGLTDAADRLVKTYSGGMRRRLDLAASLVGSPEIIFLDEPTTGLDPRSRKELWSLVRELRAGGTTVFLTTQYLEEADQLADRIAVLDAGTLVAEGTAAELKQRVADHRLDVTVADSETYLRLAHRATYSDPEARVLGIPTDGSAAEVRALLDALDPDRSAITSFTLHSATLDDVFLTLTGQPPATSPRDTAPQDSTPQDTAAPATAQTTASPLKDSSHV
ncbi:ATP-binding cassette domain-containing protein [Streptomyces mesophilus]|uniref:ATP-binding cassette domain-containing protein n=1 Tax=Streptomyces mesophilus TaxID=1775132 RepID=UPI00331BD8F8